MGECHGVGIISEPWEAGRGKSGDLPSDSPQTPFSSLIIPSWYPTSYSFSVLLLLSSIFNHRADQASFSGRHRNQGFLSAFATLVFNSTKSQVAGEIQGEISHSLTLGAFVCTFEFCQDLPNHCFNCSVAHSILRVCPSFELRSP